MKARFKGVLLFLPRRTAIGLAIIADAAVLQSISGSFNLIGKTHSNKVDSLSGLVRDTLQRMQLMPIVAFSRESFGLAKRACDSSERGFNALVLVMSARLSDPGIAKLKRLTVSCIQVLA